MKRHHAYSDAASSPTLLPELLVEVARAGGWHSAGPLARCSKRLLSLFTSPGVLWEIVDFVKASPEKRLLRWLCFALPADLIGNGVHSVHTPSLGTWQDLQALLPRAPNFLLTGGHVCARLYRSFWESDVDVFVPHACTPVPDARCQVGYRSEAFDLVPSWSEQLQCELDCFDMSVVQQGFTRDGTLFMTPLAAYTLSYKEIVVLPDEENVFYNSNWPGPRRRAPELLDSIPELWHLICAHDTPQQRFHEWALASFEEDSLTRRWAARVKKYCVRFEIFRVTYCRPPLRRRWPLMACDSGGKLVPCRCPPDLIQ